MRKTLTIEVTKRDITAARKYEEKDGFETAHNCPFARAIRRKIEGLKKKDVFVGGKGIVKIGLIPADPDDYYSSDSYKYEYKLDAEAQAFIDDFDNQNYDNLTPGKFKMTKVVA